jgi:hypothetical protein
VAKLNTLTNRQVNILRDALDMYKEEIERYEGANCMKWDKDEVEDINYLLMQLNSKEPR